MILLSLSRLLFEDSSGKVVARSVDCAVKSNCSIGGKSGGNSTTNISLELRLHVEGNISRQFPDEGVAARFEVTRVLDSKRKELVLSFLDHLAIFEFFGICSAFGAFTHYNLVVRSDVGSDDGNIDCDRRNNVVDFEIRTMSDAIVVLVFGWFVDNLETVLLKDLAQSTLDVGMALCEVDGCNPAAAVDVIAELGSGVDYRVAIAAKVFTSDTDEEFRNNVAFEGESQNVLRLRELMH